MKSFMEIGPHVSEKSERQTHRQTDRQTNSNFIYTEVNDGKECRTSELLARQLARWTPCGRW